VQDHRSWSGLLGKGSINNGRGGQLEIHFCRWSAQLEKEGRVGLCTVPCTPSHPFVAQARSTTADTLAQAVPQTRRFELHIRIHIHKE